MLFREKERDWYVLGFIYDKVTKSVSIFCMKKAPDCRVSAYTWFYSLKFQRGAVPSNLRERNRGRHLYLIDLSNGKAVSTNNYSALSSLMLTLYVLANPTKCDLENCRLKRFT